MLSIIEMVTCLVPFLHHELIMLPANHLCSLLLPLQAAKGNLQCLLGWDLFFPASHNLKWVTAVVADLQPQQVPPVPDT